MTSWSELFAGLEDTTHLQPGAPKEKKGKRDGFADLRAAELPTQPALECEESTLESGSISSADDALRFITAGNATFTIRSRKTGTRFTYRARATEDGQMIFISLLTGPDNESSYSYFGNVRPRNRAYWHGKKAKISPTAPAAKAFEWTWRALCTNQKPEALEIWHEGSCGRCGRKLTVPESIRTGFGPECAGKVGLS